MKIPRIVTLFDSVHLARITVFIGTSDVAVAKWYERRGWAFDADDKEFVKLNGSGRTAHWDDGRPIMLRLCKDSRANLFGTLAHEAVHVATFVLGTRGYHCDKRDDEAYAYYVGWIVRETLRELA